MGEIEGWRSSKRWPVTIPRRRAPQALPRDHYLTKVRTGLTCCHSTCTSTTIPTWSTCTSPHGTIEKEHRREGHDPRSRPAVRVPRLNGARTRSMATCG
jgi:hypothetical protein